MAALPREELQVRAACKLTFRWTRIDCVHLDASTVHDNKVTIVLSTDYMHSHQFLWFVAGGLRTTDCGETVYWKKIFADSCMH